MFRLISCIATLTLLAAAPIVQAANDSPVGTWRTIDDATGQAKSIVQISEHDGALQGKVIEVLLSDQGPHPVCKKCKGDLRDQPIEGMTILSGLTPNGDSWSGGHILDPSNGKTYKCKLALKDDGQKLEVRGFVGMSLLGRSQVWERVIEPAAAPPESAEDDAATDIGDEQGSAE